MARFSISSDYTYEDLNRVESKIQEIYDIIKGYYPDTPAITVKTDWDETDFPYVSLIDNIKQNIIDLSEYIKIYPLKNFRNFTLDTISFDYTTANNFEIDLEILEKALDGIILRYCGTSYLGDKIWL